MQIIVTNLPAEISEPAFRQLVTRALGIWPLRRNKDIEHVELLRLGEEGSRAEHHGLVFVNQPTKARKLIQKLDGQQCGDNRLCVRVYVHRAPSDRRYRSGEMGKVRYKERRRKGFQVSQVKSYRGVESGRTCLKRASPVELFN